MQNTNFPHLNPPLNKSINIYAFPSYGINKILIDEL